MPLIDLNGLGYFKGKENAMVAANYSASKTYAVGDYVYYSGTLYRCTTAITTAEAWTAAHWTAAKLADDLTSQSEKIEETRDLILVWSDKTFTDRDGAIDSTNGNEITSGTTSHYTKFACKDYAVIEFIASSYSSSNFGYAFVDANNEYISGSKTTVDGLMQINVPPNADQFRVCWKNGVSQNIRTARLLPDFAKIAEVNESVNKLDDITNAIFRGGIADCPLDFSFNGYIGNSGDGPNQGKLIPYSNWVCTDYIRVPTDKIATTTDASSGKGYNAFYDENYTFIDNFAVGGDVTVPTNAVYFRMSKKDSETVTAAFIVSKSIDSIYDTIIDGEIEIAGNAIFEKGYFLASDGSKQQGNSNDRYGKNLIPVKPQDIVIYHGKTSNTINGETFTQWWAYGLYDANGDFISRKTVSGDTSEAGFFEVNKEIEIPSGAYFIRLSYTAGDAYEEIGLRKQICSHTSPEIPSYYFDNNYLYDKANRIETIAKEDAANGDAFFFITDQHWTINERHSVDIINWLAKRCNIPRCFNGGDISDYGLTVGGVLAIKDYATKLRNAFDGEIYHAVGNHEYHGNATGSELYYLLDMFNNNQIGNNDRHYWYVDNPQKKLRYIILSAFQHDDNTPSVKTGYETDQVNWLRDVALDVDSGWGVIVFTHFLKADTTLSSSVVNVLDQYDGDGEIIAVIGGHTHCDYHTTTNSGIPVISVTCDKNQPWISGGVNMEPYLNDRVAGTIKEQAFDVIVVNRTDKTVTQIRIGCPIREGTDPETWTEEEEVVTSYDRA